MFKKKEIKKVFTPRKDIVNKKMYIHRKELEMELKRKINGFKHIIIYGESGCGKSWLYKKILSDEKMGYSMINLANVKRFGSITNVFKYEIAEQEKYEKTKYSDTMKAEANVVVAKGHLEHQKMYEKLEEDPLREYVKKVNNGKEIVVLDNLESIFGYTEYMQELGDILTLLDDPTYKVKFLIVGVPSGVIEYFGNRDLLKTVANRLSEVSEVRGLTEEQVIEFIKKGFLQELLVDIDDNELNNLGKHIYWVTNGIPQKVQEYCEILAYMMEEEDWKYDVSYIEKTDKTWVKDSLHKNYLLISQMMNSNQTDVGRRNQVLYCLGKIKKTVFKVSEIELLLRTEFITTTSGKNLNLRLILNEIADWKNSFIKRSEKEFIITDNQYILCIRMMLFKIDKEKIEKLDISNIN